MTGVIFCCLAPRRHSLIALYINRLSSDNTTVNIRSLCELQKNTASSQARHDRKTIKDPNRFYTLIDVIYDVLSDRP